MARQQGVSEYRAPGIAGGQTSIPPQGSVAVRRASTGRGGHRPVLVASSWAAAPLTDADWSALTDEANELVAVLGERDPTLCSRYRHWWKDIPTGHSVSI
jgi:hypothetical protein